MENEKRLIDANKLVEDLEAAKDHGGMGACVAGTLIRYVKRCATVDAMEVVRCKDCHWWQKSNKLNGSGLCRHSVFSIDDCTVDPLTDPDDFCSYGERKDNE